MNFSGLLIGLDRFETIGFPEQGIYYIQTAITSIKEEKEEIFSTWRLGNGNPEIWRLPLFGFRKEWKRWQGMASYPRSDLSK